MISVLIDKEKQEIIKQELNKEHEIAYMNEDNNVVLSEDIKKAKKMMYLRYLIIDIDLLEDGQENEFILSIQDIVFSKNDIKIMILTTDENRDKELLKKIVSFGIYNIIEYQEDIDISELAKKIIIECETKREIRDVYKYHTLNNQIQNQKKIIKTIEKPKIIERIKTEAVKNKLIAICNSTPGAGSTSIALAIAEKIANETIGGVCYIEISSEIDYIRRMHRLSTDNNLERIIQGERIETSKFYKKNKVYYLMKNEKNNKAITITDLYNIISNVREFETIIFDFNSNVKELIKNKNIWDYIYITIKDNPIYPEGNIKKIEELVKEEDINNRTNIICNKYFLRQVVRASLE